MHFFVVMSFFIKRQHLVSELIAHSSVHNTFTAKQLFLFYNWFCCGDTTWTPCWIRNAVMSSEGRSLWTGGTSDWWMTGVRGRGGQRSADQVWSDGTHCEQVDQYMWFICDEQLNIHQIRLELTRDSLTFSVSHWFRNTTAETHTWNLKPVKHPCDDC